jgi:hypothetical protein
MGEVYRGEFLGFLRAFSSEIIEFGTAFNPEGEAIEEVCVRNQGE